MSACCFGGLFICCFPSGLLKSRVFIGVFAFSTRFLYHNWRDSNIPSESRLTRRPNFGSSRRSLIWLLSQRAQPSQPFSFLHKRYGLDCLFRLGRLGRLGQQYKSCRQAVSTWSREVETGWDSPRFWLFRHGSRSGYAMVALGSLPTSSYRPDAPDPDCRIGFACRGGPGVAARLGAAGLLAGVLRRLRFGRLPWGVLGGKTRPGGAC